MQLDNPGHSGRGDAELLAAHAAGDRYAFEELFSRHRNRLHRLARRTSNCPEDADDALQDAMLSVHRRAVSFRHDAAVTSWLHRIVVNACLDRMRRNKTQSTVPLDAEIGAIPDRSAQVETAVMVRRALLLLPAEQRAAVVVVHMHGYSIADAARRFGVAEGTVKSRCARGRTRLAALLSSAGVGAVTPAG